MNKIALLGFDKRVTRVLYRMLRRHGFDVVYVDPFMEPFVLLTQEGKWSCMLFVLGEQWNSFFSFHKDFERAGVFSTIPKVYIGESKASVLLAPVMEKEYAFFLPKPIQVHVLYELLGELKEKRLAFSSDVDLPMISSKNSTHSFTGHVFGSTQLKHEIGRGGMGTVYMGYQPVLNHRVAVKFVRSDAHTSIDYLKQLQAEAIAIAQLKNEHIVQVFEAGFAREDLFYITMEFLEGQNLFQYLLYHGKMSEVQAVEVLKQVAKGLAVAHKAKIVHGDIKPSNLIIDGEGHVTITDFGAAKSLRTNHPGPNWTPQLSRIVFGTPHYFSPEQAMGQPLDERTDIYSLGIVFYELLTGSVPFDGATPAESTLLKLEQPLPDPREFVPELSSGSIVLLNKLLAFKLERRFQSCGELLEAIDLLFSENCSSLEEGEPLVGGTNAEGENRSFTSQDRQQDLGAVLGSLRGKGSVSFDTPPFSSLEEVSNGHVFDAVYQTPAELDEYVEEVFTQAFSAVKESDIKKRMDIDPLEAHLERVFTRAMKKEDET